MPTCVTRTDDACGPLAGPVRRDHLPRINSNSTLVGKKKKKNNGRTDGLGWLKKITFRHDNKKLEEKLMRGRVVMVTVWAGLFGLIEREKITRQQGPRLVR